LLTNHDAWASALSAAASKPACSVKSCHMRGHLVYVTSTPAAEALAASSPTSGASSSSVPAWISSGGSPACVPRNGEIRWSAQLDSNPGQIKPGAIIVAGDEDIAAVCEVVDLAPAGDGIIVHLRLLPGLVEDYQALVERALAS
jgi:hypothetical protein